MNFRWEIIFPDNYESLSLLFSTFQCSAKESKIIQISDTIFKIIFCFFKIIDCLCVISVQKCHKNLLCYGSFHLTCGCSMGSFILENNFSVLTNFIIFERYPLFCFLCFFFFLKLHIVGYYTLRLVLFFLFVLSNFPFLTYIVLSIFSTWCSKYSINFFEL